MRGPFDRARALLEEAEIILLKHEKAVIRELSAKEREKLRSDTTVEKTCSVYSSTGSS